jgi:hypothetical protein
MNKYDNPSRSAGGYSGQLMSTPIIRLEVDFMKATMLRHLSEEAVKIDSMVQQAVEDYCSEENLRAILNVEVKQAMDAAVREEVRSFFNGTRAGRLAVREMVIRHLDERARWHDDDKEETRHV